MLNMIRITYTWPPVFALTTCDPKRHGPPYHNSLRNLRARTCGRSELGCLTVIDGQTLSWKTKPDPVPRATNGELAGTIDNFLTDGVVNTGEIIGGIILTGYEVFMWKS